MDDDDWTESEHEGHDELDRSSPTDWLALEPAVSGDGLGNAIELLLGHDELAARRPHHSPLVEATEACRTVSSFLSADNNGSHAQTKAIVKAYERIFCRQFLAAVIAIRQEIREQAIAEERLADQFIVTPVDTLLAHLLVKLDCIGNVLAAEKLEQAVYVAIKLPSSWSGLANVLVLGAAEPSVQWAALALLYYATCTQSPRLELADPELEGFRKFAARRDNVAKWPSVVRACVFCVATAHPIDYSTEEMLHLVVRLVQEDASQSQAMLFWHAEHSMPWIWHHAGAAPVDDPDAWVADVTRRWVQSMDLPLDLVWSDGDLASRYDGHVRILLHDDGAGFRQLSQILNRDPDSFASVAGLCDLALSTCRHDPPNELVDLCGGLMAGIVALPSAFRRGKMLALKVLASLRPIDLRRAVDRSRVPLFDVLTACTDSLEALSSRPPKQTHEDQAALLLSLVTISATAEGPLDRRITKPITFLYSLTSSLAPDRVASLSPATVVGIGQLLLTVESRAEGRWSLGAQDVHNVAEALLSLEMPLAATKMATLLCLHPRELVGDSHAAVALFHALREAMHTALWGRRDDVDLDTLAAGMQACLAAADEPLRSYLVSSPLTRLLAAHLASCSGCPCELREALRVEGEKTVEVVVEAGQRAPVVEAQRWPGPSASASALKAVRVGDEVVVVTRLLPSSQSK